MNIHNFFIIMFAKYLQKKMMFSPVVIFVRLSKFLSKGKPIMLTIQLKEHKKHYLILGCNHFVV